MPGMRPRTQPGGPVTLSGSLCSGYLGLDLAAADVFGCELAWVAENDRHAATVAETRGAAPNLGDLTTVDWSTVTPVDVLTAGYPCPPFSLAGQRKGTDDVRHIWPHIAEAVRVLRPRIVVLENVAGHLSLGFGTVVGDLAALGYDARWGCVRASDVGAPHRRERVFIVATDTDRSGCERVGEPRRRGDGPADSGHVAPDPGGERQRQHPGEPPRQEEPSGRSQQDSGHVARGDGSRGAAPATCGGRLEEHPEHDRRPDSVEANDQPRHDPVRLGLDWGAYAPAIERWERTLGRPAPAPVDHKRRLDPVFVEWMMGVPEGWVTDLGLPRTAQLRVLGNGVVPQQAAHALRGLA